MSFDVAECAKLYALLADAPVYIDQQKHEDSAQTLLMRHQSFFKRSISLKDDDILKIRSALKRTVAMVAGLNCSSDAEHLIYQMVEYSSPKLHDSHLEALHHLEEHAKKCGLLSRLYRKPILRSELLEFADLARDFNMPEDVVHQLRAAAFPHFTKCAGGKVWHEMLFSDGSKQEEVAEVKEKDGKRKRMKKK